MSVSISGVISDKAHANLKALSTYLRVERFEAISRLLEKVKVPEIEVDVNIKEVKEELAAEKE